MLSPDFRRRSQKRVPLQGREEVGHLAVVEAVALLPVDQVVLVLVKLSLEALKAKGFFL